MSLKDYLAEKISYTRAFAWIIGSAIVFSFLSYKVIEFGFAKRKKTLRKHVISYIVQTGPQKEALSSDYLAELLGLSSDNPVSFAVFNTKKAEEILLSSPVISEAHVSKIKPNMVYVDYTVRKPGVRLIDFANAALDGEGTLFPIYPFFSPKRMTEVKLGADACTDAAFGKRIQGPLLDLAFSVFKQLTEKGGDLFFVKRIDTEQGAAPSLGRREVIVVLENELYLEGALTTSTHFLRLTPKRYAEEIANYIKLREHLLEAEKQENTVGSRLQDKVIDLRLLQLAYIDSGV